MADALFSLRELEEPIFGPLTADEIDRLISGLS